MRLNGKVVVVTGASSGIGRAAALTFAAKGAHVMATARRERALATLVEEIRRQGGRADALPADVTEPGALERVAEAAVERLRGLDVWVNNAGVSMFGRFDEAPEDVYRRVFEVQYFGMVAGARAAIPRFRRQGAGVLINNSSVLGALGAPYLSAYVSAKWAIRGLGECLRQELRGSGVHVCTLMPGSIDTPIFQQAANYTGRAIKPLRPVLAPERVARAMVSLARRPRREAVVGRAAAIQVIQHNLAPGVTERLAARQVERDHFKEEPVAPTAGAVLEPLPEWTSADGGWSDGHRGRAAALGALGAATALGLAARRRRG